ncbi:MAG: 50S ribosomal protein L35 [Oscillospiraceae bacterium]|jgi:large subunit ribosomal protein L35|nr:50S ribosomal protein L35 [Oscillospiraceae bacterium]
MPKIKTHSGAKKRFSLTKSGKVKRAHANKRHLLNGHGKSPKRKRGLRQGTYADVTNTAAIKRMILYK